MDHKLPFDPALHLRTDEDILNFLSQAFATHDSGLIAYALGVVMRLKGPSRVARESGLSREQLYRTLSGKGNPTLKTILAVLRSLGVDLAATAPRGMEEGAEVAGD